jgi:hypothetical protein
MKRMVSLISDQILPNFIPVNEPSTRPDVLHGIFTPSDGNMKRRWENLKAVITEKYPQTETDDVPISDAYNAREIQQRCEDLLEQYPDDEWLLNATGGTKLMSAPASEVFHRNGRDVYYVESFRNRMLKVEPNWEMTPISFTESLGVETYFRLYGREIAPGKSQSRQEKHVVKQLEQLDWRVWPSVTLKHNEQSLVEYDAIGIRHYQCSAFECKKLSDWRGEAVKDEILIDLLKLYQVQQLFGGPFGRSYWVFSGDHKLTDLEEERIRLFRINLIKGADINRIASESARFDLPERKNR